MREEAVSGFQGNDLRNEVDLNEIGGAETYPFLDASDPLRSLQFPARPSLEEAQGSGELS